MACAVPITGAECGIIIVIGTIVTVAIVVGICSYEGWL